MPQLNVYMDSETLAKVENAAKEEGCSISKWVRKSVQNSLSKGWPQGYFNVFGSLKGMGLKRPEQGSFAHDAPRKKL